VALSRSVVLPQEAYSRWGGVQVTTRQATGPEQGISWWHWPYLK
jgi:hypothetical protein